MEYTSQHDIDVRARYLKAINDKWQLDLEHLGVQVSIQHFTGDSSFPTEYRLRYSFVEAAGPTMDMAVAAFIEKLLKYVPVEKAKEA